MITRTPLCLMLLAACSGSSTDQTADDVTAEVTAGTPQRGGLLAVHLELADPARTWSASELEFFASPGLTIDAQAVTDTEIEALVAIDASAPLGDIAIEVHAGGDVLTVASAFSVGDAGEAPVIEDTLMVQPDAAGAAFAWLAPASSVALVDLEVGSSKGGVAVLDSDGAYPRPLAFPSTRTEVIDDVRGVSIYSGGDTDAFEIRARRYPLRAVATTADNHSFANATLLGTPGAYVADVTLGGANDVRYFALDVPDASIGQRLRVVTLGDSRADTQLAVYRDDHASLLGPTSNDTTALDELLTATVPAAGRYYIRVTAGAGFDPAHSSFSLAAVTR